jgi:hypothetical protein
MSGIDRIGQRVVCVQDHVVWANFCCDAITRWPLLDEIYTVAGFAEIDGVPGIFLAELPPVTCECHLLSGAPWPLQCFRPLDERKTDIGSLTKILTEQHDAETVSEKQRDVCFRG